MDLEEKKKKLALLKEKNRMKADVSKDVPISTSIKDKYSSINDLADTILKEHSSAEKSRPLQQIKEEKKTESLSPVRPLRKKRMELVSFVGELSLGKAITKYDQEVQVAFDNHNTTPNRPRKTIDEIPEGVLPVVSRLSKIPQQMLNEMYSHGVGAHKEQKEEKKNLSQEDIKSILKSQNFQEFFNKTTKMIERALDGDDDNINLMENIMEKDQIVDKEESKSDILKHSIKFYDNNHSTNRIVTGIEWSPNLDDLFLASYGQNDEGSINDPLGVVLLWSLSLKSRPEFYCFCQSPVTSSCFYPYSHNLLLGGLYNGTIVIWDLRAKTSPVQRTTLSSGGHTFPIYSLAVIGSQNAHNIVSISNDGKLCLWNMNMLTSPNKIIDLKHKNNDKSAAKDNLSDINVTCMAFPENDPNNFYIGSEDGTVYQSQVHGNQLKSDNVVETFKEHEAPVTSISILPQFHDNPPFMQGLMLSSSFDWSVKLWNPRATSNCVWSFESAEDYVYDVSWNRANPCLFGSVDGEGFIDLWDLEGDLEVPLLHYKSGNTSLNKLRWNKDGSKLLVGDTIGNVNLYNMDKSHLKYNSEKLHELENVLTPKS